MENDNNEFQDCRKEAECTGCPPYVFAEVNALKMQKRWAGDDIIDLGMGNPDLPAPKHIIEKLVEAARKKHNHRYSASRGITRLREASGRMVQEKI